MFRFLLAALATWRLAFLLAREDGPWHIFARLRNRLGKWLPRPVAWMRKVRGNVGVDTFCVLCEGRLDRAGGHLAGARWRHRIDR